MAFTRPAVILLNKELRTEFRTKELLATTLVFVLMVLVLFSFTFDPTSAESRRFRTRFTLAGTIIRSVA